MTPIPDESPFSTHGLFHDAAGRVAPSPTTLADADAAVDEAAVFSVLQLGAIVPPLSPWKGVRRFLPGYQYHGTEMVGPVKLPSPAHIAGFDEERQADEIERLLDAAIGKILGDRTDPVVLYSGGVDSGLVGCRLAAMGYRDALLINYSFGENDAEGQLAEAMAKHLGLRFERVLPRGRPCDCLEQPGQVFAQPFSDPSTVPTSDLAHSVVSLLGGENRLILDGIGADVAFGSTSKIESWQRVLRVPRPARRAASWVYGAMLWHRKGRVEFPLRILRRSIEMPLLSAIIAQNGLAGVLYQSACQASVHALLADWVGGWAGESSVHRIIAADLAIGSANTFAQKPLPILESAGHRVFSPFLDTEVLATALASITGWQMSEPKAPLKRAMARCVPREMVYRRKSSFVDPRDQVFHNPRFIAYLRAAAEPTGPIGFMLKPRPLHRACDLLSRGVDLPNQTLNCLWAIVFTDRWYRTARSTAPSPAP